jgi:hypothetical protein
MRQGTLQVFELDWAALFRTLALHWIDTFPVSFSIFKSPSELLFACACLEVCWGAGCATSYDAAC